MVWLLYLNFSWITAKFSDVRKFRKLTVSCVCDWFESYIVVNPKARFFRFEAHLMKKESEHEKL